MRTAHLPVASRQQAGSAPGVAPHMNPIFAEAQVVWPAAVVLLAIMLAVRAYFFHRHVQKSEESIAQLRGECDATLHRLRELRLTTACKRIGHVPDSRLRLG